MQRVFIETEVILEKSDSENISAAGKIILRNLARQLKQ
jgi:hypothetical protein